jgi:spore coat protein U-like protein
MIKSKVRIALVAAAAALTCSAGFAQSMNMEVKASVTGTCKMVAANALDFGTLDPVLAPAVTGKTTTIQYLCTKGKAPTSITIDGDNDGAYTGAMTHATLAAETIAFSLAWNSTLQAGAGMGAGKEISMTVTGAIGSGVYSNNAAGNYSVMLPVVLTP